MVEGRVQAPSQVSPLDLHSEAGASVMFRRLDAAARELCAMTRSPLLPSVEGREWRCRREALAAAVQRLNAPRLALAYSDWLSADPAVALPSPRPR
jgi:UrcA family protein